MQNKTLVFKRLLIGLVVALIASGWYALSAGGQLASFLGADPALALDTRIQDAVYQSPRLPSPHIYVIGIDENTLRELGPWHTWSRSLMAEMVQVLNADPENAPAVIGVDVSYFQNTQPEADAALAAAAKQGGNVVVACEAVFDDVLAYDEAGRPFLQRMQTVNMDFPYDALREASTQGFINTLPDQDGVIRQSTLQVDFEGEQTFGFSYEIYRQYATMRGLPQDAAPPLDENGRFPIAYSALPGDYYGQNSFVSVLRGEIPPSAFAGGIVLIGPYATGMMDQYYTPLDAGQMMYGVEIHANLIQAFLEQNFKQVVPVWPQALVLFLVMLLAYLAFYKLDPRLSALLLLAAGGGYVGLAVLLYRGGYIINLLYLPALLALLYLYRVVYFYFVERLRRKTVTDTFKRYMEPSVVEHLLSDSRARESMCGAKRDIAVLFIDIRGFTTLSETMDALDVVGLLNHYLTVVSREIFHNKGTLDKFVGDAAMAIYNAPLELDDYTFRAVKTAWDIAAHAQELAKELQQKYGQAVSFGIGVNCGEAIVGNIGASFRMDYTAIGDTVNTAARLESRAGPGQILISETVYKRLEGRVEARCIGPMQLKGKQREIITYEVTGWQEGEVG